MALGDLLPEGQGRVFFAQGGQRLGQGHRDAPREGTQPTWLPLEAGPHDPAPHGPP
jgi:hypothetical protein